MSEWGFVQWGYVQWGFVQGPLSLDQKCMITSALYQMALALAKVTS